MNQPLIRLTEIAAAYDQKKVLEHINLEIAEKDFLGVIGPNGGGKTTLMKIILGLLKPTAGKIQFFHLAGNWRYAWLSQPNRCQGIGRSGHHSIP